MAEAQLAANRAKCAPEGEGVAVAEVFISYSQKERALIAPIAERLAELGVDAWFDREISAGERFGAVIRARLKEAKAVLACWSPEATQSDWVEAEADYARELGTYVPLFVAPCALMPPFNRIHTEDLSKWTGESSDPTWIKLVERIAKLIGREGVAAAARASATGDEQTLYDFARRYPDEPTARKIWSAAEARHREHFERRLAAAKRAADARISEQRAALEVQINGEHAALDSRLQTVTPAFEVWLADERCGAAKGPPPDPLELIGPAERGEQRLREEIAALRSALSEAKGRDEELAAAKAEVARLSREFVLFRGAFSEAKAKEGRLSAAEAEIERLSRELAEQKVQGLHSLTEQEVEELYRQVLANQEATLGRDHPEVAIHLINLAWLLQRTNRPDEAAPLFTRALAIFEKSFGAGHPHTASLREALAAQGLLPTQAMASETDLDETKPPPRHR
jgi:tetratricopeptide (TPR) repeat protein